MEEKIYFETTIKSNQTVVQKIIATDSNIKWLVEELWCTDEYGFVHKITLRKADDSECNYYADLELFPIPNADECKIEKATRSCSSEIEFKVHEAEYRCFKDSTHKPSTQKVYGINVVLSPILELEDIPDIEGKINKKRNWMKTHLIPELKNLSQNIHQLLEKKFSFFYDVILHCGNETPKYANRNVLCARSPRFLAIFNQITQDGDPIKKASDYAPAPLRLKRSSDSVPHGTDDSRAKFVLNPRPHSNTFCEVMLDDVLPELFPYFVNFIYSGIYANYDLYSTMNLYLVARKYCLHDLEVKCLLSLKKIITPDNALDVFVFAYMNVKKEILVVVEKYIMYGRRYDLIHEFLHTPIWESLTLKYPLMRDEMMDLAYRAISQQFSNEKPNREQAVRRCSNCSFRQYSSWW